MSAVVGFWAGSGLCFCGTDCSCSCWTFPVWEVGDDTVRGRVNSEAGGDCAEAAANAREITRGVTAREPNFINILSGSVDLTLARGGEL